MGKFRCFIWNNLILSSDVPNLYFVNSLRSWKMTVFSFFLHIVFEYIPQAIELSKDGNVRLISVIVLKCLQLVTIHGA